MEGNEMVPKNRTLLLPLAKLFTLVLIVFVTCAFSIILYSVYHYAQLQTRILNSSLETYSAQLAKSTSESYETYENICYSVAYNQSIQGFLSGAPGKDSSSYSQYQQLSNLLTNTANLNPYITDVAVYGENGNFVSLNSTSVNYDPLVENIPKSRFSYCSVGTAAINRTYCHVMAMPVYSFTGGENRYLGMMFLAIDINSLFGYNLYNSSKEYEPMIVFTDSESNLLYGDEFLYRTLQEAPGTEADLFNVSASHPSVTYVVNRYTLPTIQHTLYVLIDKSHNTRQVTGISLRLLLYMGVLTIITLLLLLLLYRPLIHSLNQLTAFMKVITNGNRKASREGFSVEQGLIGTLEIAQISNAFNDMLVESERLNHTIFETYTRMYELEDNSRQTEIAFLRSQINPHFLYNTLTMICGMAAEGTTDKIISVTGALSQIFRYSIKGSDKVPLREELEIVRSYLMIQKERFENRFQVCYEFSEDSYDCLIPKMVIQPLVENAIVHGLEKSLNPGKLLLGAGRNPEHGYLAIWIFDTGVGMPPDKLEELRKAVSSSSEASAKDAASQHRDSIGILNVNSRMVLYYGNEYTLIIDSEEGVGTNIQLRVPYQTRTDEARP